jgi:glycosyltransferase involved in cell wall biosynthesis
MTDRQPRVLFVGRARYRLPLPAWLAKKWDALEHELDYRLLGSAERGSPLVSERFRLAAPLRSRVLDAPLFYARLPFRIRNQIKEFAPEVIVAGDPYVGAAALLGRRLARSDARLIVEVHGDWRTFTRGYGSGARRLFSPGADFVSRYAVRHADATRALSGFTSGLIESVRGRPATAAFPTYSDLSAFTEHPVAPLPDRPVAVFIAALEAYKNVDGLAAAWRRVAATVPDARLVIIGKGSKRDVVDGLVRELPLQVVHYPELLPTEVAAQLDTATLLVLPSWPEGLGRVVIEAFARGRGVIATGAGGVLDLVTDGEEGLLIPPADTDGLVAALERVLTDRGLAERFGAAAHARYPDWHSTPELFASQMRDLVDRVIAGADGGPM